MFSMSKKSKLEYLQRIQPGYLSSSKTAKGAMLVEASKVTGYSTKYLSYLLHYIASSGNPPPRLHSASPGRKVKYGNEFKYALSICWFAMNQTCAENLQPELKNLVPRLIELDELNITKEIECLLLSASVSTVARCIRQIERATHTKIKGLSTTKPGTILRRQIAVRKGRWNESKPGSLETDTVAHCCESVAGEYVNTYNFIDIFSGWTELVATPNKGAYQTVIALDQVKSRLPFVIRGIDSDNGAEYINHHLQRYCLANNLNFTRSRPYHSNDNAHVEQRNYEAVRKIIGYGRLEGQESTDLLNKLYAGPLRLYLNYFKPIRRLRHKEVDLITGSVKKKYFEAKTPYTRLLESSDVDDNTKLMLQLEYKQLNPIELLAEINQLVDEIQKRFIPI